MTTEDLMLLESEIRDDLYSMHCQQVEHMRKVREGEKELNSSWIKALEYKRRVYMAFRVEIRNLIRWRLVKEEAEIELSRVTDGRALTDEELMPIIYRRCRIKHIQQVIAHRHGQEFLDEILELADEKTAKDCKLIMASDNPSEYLKILPKETLKVL